MDFNSLFSLKQAWDSFKGNHPKFPEFLKAVRDRGACEGTEVFIAVTYPDGQQIKAGVRLKQSDIELINNLGNLM